MMESLKKQKNESIVRIDKMLTKRGEINDKKLQKDLLEAIDLGLSNEELIELGYSQKEIDKSRRVNTEEKKNDTSNDKKSENEEKIKNLQNDTAKILEKENNAKSLDATMKQIGLSELDFEKIPEWANLSHGQKLMVVEQISQRTLENVKESGEERFNKENKISFKAKDFNPASLGGKIWRNFFKTAYVHKENRKAVLEAAQGKLSPEKEVVEQIVKNNADMNLNIEDKDGKAFVNFVSGEMKISKEDKAIADRYNEIANEYAKIPDEWKNEKAAKSSDSLERGKYEKYQKSKAAYEQVRAEFVEMRKRFYQKEKEGGGEKKAMFEARDIDFQVEMLKLANKSPDAISELSKIHNTSSFKKMFTEKESLYRGFYMGTGYLARSVTASTLGLVAAPLVAGILGGARARRKANQKINEAMLEGREEKTFRERREGNQSGTYDDKNAGKKGLMTSIMPGMTGVNAKEVAGFVDADSQIQRLENLMAKYHSSETSDVEKNRIISQLSARIDYTEQKHKEGLINYGAKNPTGLGYSLLKLLSEAEVTVATHQMYPIDIGKITNPDVLNKIDPKFIEGLKDYDMSALDNRRSQILGKVMQHNLSQQEFEQTYFKNTETAKGVMMGAGFSVLGMAIRDLYHGEIGNDLRKVRDALHIGPAHPAGVVSTIGNVDNSNYYIDHKNADGVFANKPILKQPVDQFGRVDSSHINQNIVDSTQTNINPSDSSNLVNPVVKPNIDQTIMDNKPSLDAHKIISAEVGKGRGAIQTLRDLQKNLRAEYGTDVTKAPASVQHILNTSPTKLAEEYGMYRPNDPTGLESALTKVGAKFEVDQNGNLTYQAPGANQSTILERGNEIKGSASYDGKMIDTDSNIKSGGLNSSREPNTYSYYDTKEYELENTPKAPVIEDLNNNTPNLNPKNIPEGIKIENTPKAPVIEDLNSKVSTPKLEVENPNEVKANPNVFASRDISPNKPDGFNSINSGQVISPRTGNFNTGEEVGKIYPNGGATTDGTPNGPFTRVSMTDRDIVPNQRLNIETPVNLNEGGAGIENIEADPRHLETASQIRQRFGNPIKVRYDEYNNSIDIGKETGGPGVVINKPDESTIDGIKYRDLVKATDTMLEQKNLPINSYEDLTKEHQLQKLFGHNSEVKNPSQIVYDETSGRNIKIPESTTISQVYFRETPEWKVVSKVPAKYFFNENFADGNDISEKDMNMLVENKVINTSSEVPTFTHRDELLRLSNTYRKLMPKSEQILGNDKPIGNETMETYVKRLTERVYETDNGTVYGLKRPMGEVLQGGNTDGAVVRSENIPGRSISTSNISPRRGVWQTSSNRMSSPNFPVANRATRNILDWIFGR